jgi:hypothetical protein
LLYADNPSVCSTQVEPPSVVRWTSPKPPTENPVEELTNETLICCSPEALACLVQVEPPLTV